VIFPILVAHLVHIVKDVASWVFIHLGDVELCVSAYSISLILLR
jgi:hypothetical protein